jgi:DNA-binding MarR family transcriptional regulator
MPESSTFRYARADDSPGFLLWKIWALWHKKLTQVLSAFHITQTQYAILASLRWFEEQAEPPAQTHLVEHAKIDKMTVSKAVRKLEQAGLVSRGRSESDSRATHVQLSPGGRKIAQRAIEAVENADEEFFACLSKHQINAYKTLALAVIAHNGTGPGIEDQP